MATIKTEIRYSQSRLLTEMAKSINIPLRRIMDVTAHSVVARVRRGQGPTGPWRRYGVTAPSQRRGKWLYWVPPEWPQPDGWLAKPSKGEMAGWAAYETYRDYLEKGGKLYKPHDFDRSGEQWTKLAIRMIDARRMRLAFYGRHRGSGQSAKQVGRFMARQERHPLFKLTRAEIAEVERMATDGLTSDWSDVARQSATLQRLSSMSRAGVRRASRLIGG